MVKIRMARKGTKKRPFYHIIATDERSPRNGRYLQRVGYYNPIATGAEKMVELNMERVNYWIAQGAQLSETVARLVEGYEPTSAVAA
jgi:small subunit ribosomal protein S16